MPKKAKALWEVPQGFHKKGGDLLSHFRSTIGAEGLNFSVRNGKRWNTLAITTYLFLSHVPLSSDSLTLVEMLFFYLIL